MKWLISIVAVVMVVAVLWWMPSTFIKTITVPEDPYQLVQMLQSPALVEKWTEESGREVIQVEQAASNQLVYYTSSSRLYITVMPATQVAHSLVQMQVSASVLTKLWVKLTGRHPVSNFAAHLVEALHIPLDRYGFDIMIAPVADSVLLTKTDTVERELLHIVTDSLLRAVYAELQQPDPGYCYISASPMHGNQIEAAVALPVSSTTAQQKHLHALRLPSGGRILHGQSIQSKQDELIAAMKRYMQDNGLKQVALPMQKMPFSNGAVVRDASQTTEILIPIY